VRYRDKPRVPRLARADINFLAGIIKRGYPTAPYLSDMRRELLVASMGEKTMESFAYGIGNLVGFQLIVGSCSASTWRRRSLPWSGVITGGRGSVF